jgi:LuxR family transcriptional regulator, maltose regulon positive regulatory protein
MSRFTTRQVRGRHQILVISLGYAGRVPGGDGAMTGRQAAGGRAAVAARQGLIDRHDLVAALGRAAGKRVTVISAPAGGGKTSLLHAWAGWPGQDRLMAFMSVQRGQRRRFT